MHDTALHDRRSAVQVTSGLYFALFFFGFVVFVRTYTSIYFEKISGLNAYIAFIFGFFTVLLEVTVYLDLKSIEHGSSAASNMASRDYAGWENSYPEVGLRILIIVFLLFTAGEAHEYISFSGIISIIRDRLGVGQISGDTVALDEFMFSTMVTFALLFCWNFGAAYHRIVSSRSTTVDNLASAHIGLVTLRISMFAFVSILCVVYWFLVLTRQNSEFAKVVVIIYFGIATLVLVLRSDLVTGWIANKLVQIGSATAVSEVLCGHQRSLSIYQRRSWDTKVATLYTEMRTKAEEGIYGTNFRGMQLVVLPGVYSPAFFDDTSWFAEKISAEVVQGMDVLEIGTGTGAIAITCAKKGARVLATDVSKVAVLNASINSFLSKTPINLRVSNIFRSLTQPEVFDLIFWVHPFNKWLLPVNDELLRTGRDHNYMFLREYIGNSSKHLKDKGRLFLGTSDTADLKTISQICHFYGYSVKIIDHGQTNLSLTSQEKIKLLLCELSRSQ